MISMWWRIFLSSLNAVTTLICLKYIRYSTMSRQSRTLEALTVSRWRTQSVSISTMPRKSMLQATKRTTPSIWWNDFSANKPSFSSNPSLCGTMVIQWMTYHQNIAVKMKVMIMKFHSLCLTDLSYNIVSLTVPTFPKRQSSIWCKTMALSASPAHSKLFSLALTYPMAVNTFN